MDRFFEHEAGTAAGAGSAEEASSAMELSQEDWFVNEGQVEDDFDHAAFFFQQENGHHGDNSFPLAQQDLDHLPNKPPASLCFSLW